MADNQATLSFLEARILGVLIEKEKTTPDAYPLTLNSLTAGCNQKSARDPVTSVIDSEVQAALEELRGRILVLETYGAGNPGTAWPADHQRATRQQRATVPL